MKLQTLALAATLSLGLSAVLGGAALADGQLNAALRAPAAKTKVVAGGAVWTCDGAACVAAAAPSRAFSAAGCKALVKEVGPVAAVGAEARQLDGADLAKCNGETAVASAKPTPAAAN